MRVADQLVGEAIKSGQFAFPPVTDVRIDQARGGDRVRPGQGRLDGPQHAAGRGRSGHHAERQLHQPVQHGRSQLQGDRPDRARRPPRRRPTWRISTSPARTGRSSRCRPSPRFRTGVEPRTLNRFQQLNSVKISGVAPQSLDGGLQVLESVGGAPAAPGQPLRLHRRVAAAAPGGGQVPARHGPGRRAHLPGAGRAVQLVPGSHRGARRLGAAGDVRRAGVHLPQVLGPARDDASASPTAGPPPSTSTRRWAWSRWSGLIAKNGILVVQFANLEQARGLSKVAAVQAAAETRLRPILMTTIATVAGHFPLTLVSGPGRGGPELDRHRAGRRDGHRHDLHAVRGPVGLRPGGQGPQQGARTPGPRGDGAGRRARTAGRYLKISCWARPRRSSCGSSRSRYLPRGEQGRSPRAWACACRSWGAEGSAASGTAGSPSVCPGRPVA